MSVNLARQFIPYITHEAWLAERAKDITSTETAALFDCSPYLTRYELWHRKRGDYTVAFQDNPRTVWGKRLQDAIAEGIAEDNGWFGERMDEYMRLPEHRIGASFDFRVWARYAGPRDIPDDAMLLEIKNVDSLVFRNEWTEDEDGNIEPPLHILFQVHTQMLVSGITTAYVAALVGGNRASLYRCEYDEQIGARIIEEADKLWNGPEPTPDFHRDADVIAKLYGYSEPDSVMQATPDMERLMAEADEHRRLSAVHNDEYEARQAELRMLSGRAERVEAEGYTLSLGMRAPVEVKAHTRAGYRGFNLTKRKRK